MTWLLNETITAGNSTARVKNFYPDSGLLVLMDINGPISAGMTVTGTESGTTVILSNFTIADEYDLGYEDPLSWKPLLDRAIYAQSGELVTLDSIFSTSVNKQKGLYLVVDTNAVWETVKEDVITDDSGNPLVTDYFFNEGHEQNFQTTYLITEE